MLVANCWQTPRPKSPYLALNEKWRGRVPQGGEAQKLAFLLAKMAEGEGFEPPVPLRARMISSNGRIVAA